MIQLNEYLNTNVKVRNNEFPEYPVEKDILDFLENTEYQKIEIIEPSSDDNETYYRKTYKEIEDKSNGKSYCFVKHEFVEFNDIYIFNGGKISKNNPCFQITVFKNIKKINTKFVIGEIICSKKVSENKRYNMSEYKEFLKELSKYCIW